MAHTAVHSIRPGEQAGMVLASQWSEFCRLRNVVLAGGDSEAIHDLRVASRRLRAVLALFVPYLPGGRTKILSREIRSLTATLGNVRNLDEALQYFSALPTLLPGLMARLGIARKKAAKGVTKALEAFSCREWDQTVRSMAVDLTAAVSTAGSEEVVMGYLAETGERRYRQVTKLLVAAVAIENVEGRHRFRIAIKKWRYLLEAVGQMTGRKFGETLDVLKSYQTALGKLNDMVVFSELCRAQCCSKREMRAARSALTEDTARYLRAFMELESGHLLHNPIPGEVQNR